MAAYRIGDIVAKKERGLGNVDIAKKFKVVARNFTKWIMEDDGMYSYYRYVLEDVETGRVLQGDFDEGELRRM